MTFIKKYSSAIILFALFSIFIICVIFFTRSIGSYRFYYPDNDLRILKSEQRRLYNPLSSGVSKEEKIIREYFLGPIRYDLKLPVKEKVKIENIWLIDYEGKEALVINFNADFLDFVQSDREDAMWVMEGLIETIKADTSVEKLNIYADDKPVRTRLGNLNLANTILLIKKIKK